MRTTLLVLLAVGGALFIIAWIRAVQARRAVDVVDTRRPTPLQLVIGFVTNFFDTLGIGSFATTTTVYKMLRIVPDERIVGTMLMGHSLPVIVQAFIFLVVVRVDATLLAMLILVSIVGGWLGAGVASQLPRRPIQIFMSIGLFAAATFMLLSKLGMFPVGGTALTLESGRLVIALVANFLLGGLVMLGIGNYAPSLILFSLLGMDPRAAFPIMMGSAAMMGMSGGLRFTKTGRFDSRAALGLTLGGIPGVLLAGLVVQSLPLGALQWMVIVVVTYAASMMMRSAVVERRTGRMVPATPVDDVAAAPV